MVRLLPLIHVEEQENLTAVYMAGMKLWMAVVWNVVTAVWCLLAMDLVNTIGKAVFVMAARRNPPLNSRQSARCIMEIIGFAITLPMIFAIRVRMSGLQDHFYILLGQIPPTYRFSNAKRNYTVTFAWFGPPANTCHWIALCNSSIKKPKNLQVTKYLGTVSSQEISGAIYLKQISSHIWTLFPDIIKMQKLLPSAQASLYWNSYLQTASEYKVDVITTVPHRTLVVWRPHIVLLPLGKFHHNYPSGASTTGTLPAI